MFERYNDASQLPPIRSEAIRGIERVCEIFDPLLEDPTHDLFPNQKSELAALARIFDISTSREPAEVWSDIRTMLVLQPASNTAEPVHALTIIVVEDDPDIAASIIETLTEFGHRLVGPFESADAAEVSAALHQVDLALIDINLASDANGLDLARSLKSRWGVPTILISGDVTALSAVGNLGDAMLLKPFTSTALRDAISQVVGSQTVESV